MLWISLTDCSASKIHRHRYGVGGLGFRPGFRDTTAAIRRCRLTSRHVGTPATDRPRLVPFPLGIEGGEVVTPRGRSRLHVYVADGRIAEIGAERHDAAEVVDASGLLVLPGLVDAHVHFMDPADTTREDFPSGTAAAARAGVTTVVEHTHARPVIAASDLYEKREYLATRSRVDFALGAHAWPDRLDEVEGVWRAGVAFVKAFTCTTHGVPGFDAASLRRLFERAAACGGVCLVHCEDERLTGDAERELRASGREDGGIVPLWRNRDAELTALRVTSQLARSCGASVVAAHVSSEAALGHVDGLVVESCPQYLTMLENEVLDHGAFRKFTPPARARNRADLDAMWRALADGRISYISSDHAPSTAEQKRAGSIWDVHFGLPGIDTTSSVLLDGAHAGRISYERVAEAYSERPARLYGLWPAKGRLEPGADADLVLVDPEAPWEVRDEDEISKAGWSPYSGRTLVGRAVRTYLRGELAAVEGRIVAEPATGRFVAGAGRPGR
jgi:dihydroorotase (multifunctional complex type)